MELELYKMEAQEQMETALDNYNKNLSKINAGRANPAILDSIQVNYFDAPTPIQQIAAISIPEPRQLLIKPFDMSITKDIVASINKSSLGVQAVDEGDKARITLPEATRERRQELVKSLSNYTEQAKIQIRAARQNANKGIKSDEELSEDEERNYQEEIQNLTNKFIGLIDEKTKEKEKNLMTI